MFFISNRSSPNVDNHLGSSIDLLKFPETFQKDIYAIEVKSGELEQFTHSLEWSESQPKVTSGWDLVYISDKKGIPNLYKMNIKESYGEEKTITNIQSGILRYDIDRMGSRAVVNALNETKLHLYTIISFNLRSVNQEDVEPNFWARQRKEEPLFKRVPALGVYLLSDSLITGTQNIGDSSNVSLEKKESDSDISQDGEEINFRNYIFSDIILKDSSLFDQDLLDRFNVSQSKLSDGRYQPRRYRIKLTNDISFVSGSVSTGYFGGGAYGVLSFSDILGDHNLLFFLGSLNSSLRLGNYGLAYIFRKFRWNYSISFSHSSYSYNSIYGETLQYRNASLSLATSYPFDTFSRVNINLNGIYITRNYSSRDNFILETERRWLFYPSISYSVDKTGFGFIYPYEGYRLFFSLYGSPPLSRNHFQFISASADLRKYVYLGKGSSLALRFSGATSYGKDDQIFFLGGISGWLNSRYDNSRTLLISRFEDSFFSYPGFPLRGYGYNAISGNHYGLVNIELRFPFFQVLTLSSLSSILPFYNLDFLGFLDVGTAWGKDFSLQYEYTVGQENRLFTYVNSSDLDFSLRRETTLFLDSNGEVTNEEDASGSIQIYKGDILASLGVGLRAIVLGLPFRYDVAWPFNGTRIGSKPTHHISLGIDF